MKVRVRRPRPGRVTFQLDYSLGGQRIQRTIPGFYVERVPGEADAAFERRVQKAFRAAKQDAELIYHEQKRHEALGGLAGPSLRARSLTLDAAVTAYIRREGLSDYTRVHYSEKASVLYEFFGRNAKVMALQANEIGQFSTWYLARGTDQERLASTVNKPLRLLRGVLNWLKQNRDITQVPHIELLPEQEPRRRFLTVDEARRLLAAISDSRTHEIVTVYLNTGLRRGELFRIRTSDIDFDRRTLTLETRKRGKSALVVRDTIPLNEAVVDVMSRLSKAAQGDDALVFGISPQQRNQKFRSRKRPAASHVGNCQAPTNLEMHNLNRQLKRAAKAAGLERPDEVSVHTLRHTFASNCIHNGVNVRDVQALLRHRSPLLTLKTYCHEGMDTMRQGVESLSFD